MMPRAMRTPSAASVLSFLALLLAPPLASPAIAEASSSYENPVADIDRILQSTWESEGLESSAPASDAEFHRRAWLDIAGVVPSRAEVEAYLADASTDKAGRLIANLLASPEYSRHWALVWQSALMGRGDRRAQADTRFYPWIEKAVRENEHWDDLANELLTAEGHVPVNFPPRQFAEVAAQYEGVQIETGASPVAYMAQFTPNKAGYSPPTAVGHTAKIFLGIRIECAECHNHPWEKWTQADFQGMEAFFKRTALRPLPDPPKIDRNNNDPKRLVIAALTEKSVSGDQRGAKFAQMMSGETPPELERINSRIAELEKALARGGLGERQTRQSERELSRLKEQKEKGLAKFEEAKKKLLSNPDMKDLIEAQSYPVKFLFGQEVSEKEVGPENLRKEYARLILSNTDHQFARNIANRLWEHYFGRGLVHPVDDFRESNPAAIPELMEYLTGLMEHIDYDTREYARILTSTRAYRLSSVTNETNRDDEVLYSRRIPVPLSVEQTAFSLLRVRSTRTYARLDEGLDFLSRIVRQFVQALDDDEGAEVSDFTGTIPKSLFMMNAENLNGLPEIPLDVEGDPATIVDQLFLTVLARPATEEETFLFGNHLGETPELPSGWRNRLGGQPESLPPRLRAVLDIYWALMNSAEFTYNH